MTLSDEIEMVEGHGTMNPYVFFMAGIPRLCIPDMGLDDGPNGVADGLTGVTALPSILAFIPAWLTATGIQVFSLISPLTPPISYMAYGIGGFMGWEWCISWCCGGATAGGWSTWGSCISISRWKRPRRNLRLRGNRAAGLGHDRE